MVKKQKSKKDYMTTLLLSIFLGQFGADRFYLRRDGTALLKLLITICSFGLLGWIWWLIDLILIASRKMTDCDGLELA